MKGSKSKSMKHNIIWIKFGKKNSVFFFLNSLIPIQTVPERWPAVSRRPCVNCRLNTYWSKTQSCVQYNFDESLKGSIEDVEECVFLKVSFVYLWSSCVRFIGNFLGTFETVLLCVTYYVPGDPLMKIITTRDLDAHYFMQKYWISVSLNKDRKTWLRT